MYVYIYIYNISLSLYIYIYNVYICSSSRSTPWSTGTLLEAQTLLNVIVISKYIYIYI